MKKQILKLAALVSLCAGNAALCWDFKIENNTQMTIMVYADFWLCNDDRFILTPRQSKTIDAGLCDLVAVSATNTANHVTTFYRVKHRQMPLAGLQITTDIDGNPLISNK